MAPSRRALLTLVLASGAVLVGGLMVSASGFPAYLAHGWRALIISDILSPEDNPARYVHGAVATAVSGALLLPVVAGIHRRLARRRHVAASLGRVFLTAGACGAMAIGVLAPFPVSYDDIHIPLAFATFIAIVAGLTCDVIVLMTTAPSVNGWRRQALHACLFVQAALLPFLTYLYFVPDFFDGRTLFTTLALLEWSLCAGILVMLLLVIASLPRDAAATPSSRHQPVADRLEVRRGR